MHGLFFHQRGREHLPLQLPPLRLALASPLVSQYCTISSSFIRHVLVLLVVLVPQLVPFKFVSTTLGVHKSVNRLFSPVSLSEL